MEKFTTELFAGMQGQLKKLGSTADDALEKAMQAFHLVETTMIKLKQFVLDYTFPNKSEEIIFFKVIKPRFHSELIFYLEVIHMETNRPVGSSQEALINYYQQIIDRQTLFFAKQNMIYLYYKTGRSDQDDLLFLREADCIPLVPEDAVDWDTSFSTLAGSITARIMGFEKVIQLLKLKQDRLKQGNFELEAAREDMQWTGTKTELTELVYGIHASKRVNGGNISVKQLLRAFEEFLHCNVGNHHRTFQSMQFRTGSRTIFIDKMKIDLDGRLDK